MAEVQRVSAADFELSAPATRETSVVRTAKPSSLARKLRVTVADFTAGVIGIIAAGRVWAGDDQTRLNEHRHVLVLAMFLLPLFMAHAGLYRSGAVARRASELKRLAEAVALWVVGLIVVQFMAAVPMSRGLVISVSAATLGMLIIEREVVRQVFAQLRKSKRIVRRALVVGGEIGAADGAANLDRETAGYDVVGLVLTDTGTLPNFVGPRRVLGNIERIFEIVEHEEIDTVLINDGLDPYASTRLVRQLADLGVHVEVSLSVRDVADSRLQVTERGRIAVAHVMPPIRTGWRMVAKRVFDIALASFGLLLASPVLVAIAVAIKVESRGPVLFRQKRVGRDGVEFPILKFRSMVVDAEARLAELMAKNEADGPLFKMKDDPRITRTGRLLRKTSLDELPQLWNVIRGDMSLVGPRPALASEVAQWTPDLFHRLRVRPGLTGLWQVSGRSDSTFESYERYDLYYTDNWSLARDLAIILRTIPAVLAQRGAR